MKKCKECRDPFEPRFNSLEKYCWKHECKFIEAMQKVEQKKKSESKEWSERKSKLKKELLTVQDTAKFLSLSVPTVYTLISKGELPVMKRSKRCYFSRVELINYLKQGRKKTLAETASEADTYLKKKGGKF